MKKVLFLLLLFALAAGGTWYLNQERPTKVSVVSPERGRIEAVIRVTGKVVNDRTVNMTALVDGQITEMSARKGDSVEAGQVLTVLDRREAEARLRKAQAETQREKQAVAEAARKVARLQGVLKSGGATTQVVEDAQAEQRSARARLKVAEAVLEIEKIHREKVEVTAPFAGIITEKTTEVGQWVEAGTNLFTLVAHEGREIEVNVDAGDSAVVQPGQLVTLSADAYPDFSWQASIARISPAIAVQQDQALNTFSVRITLGDARPKLLLGQQVDARIHTDTREAVLTLPFDALIERGETTEVAIVRNGSVAYLPIETGLEDFTHVEVVAGLGGDERVILVEGRELPEGALVEIGGESQ